MGKNQQFVLNGAAIKCCMGDVSAKLTVTTNFTYYTKGKLVDTAMDCTNVNMLPLVGTFGTCKPYKATPMPICTFIPTGSWKMPYSKQTLTGLKPSLWGSFLICPRGGGRITITKTGQ